MTWLRDKRVELAALAAVVMLHALSVFWVQWAGVKLEPDAFVPDPQRSQDDEFARWVALQPHGAPWLFVRNWGWHFVKYFPAPVVAACYAFALVLLVPAVHRRLARELERAAETLAQMWDPPPRRVAMAAGGLIVFLAITALLRQDWALLGDNAEGAEALQSGNIHIAVPEILGYAYFQAVLAVGKSLVANWNGLDAYRWGNWLAGLLYLPVAFVIARLLGRSLFEKAAYFLALLTLGNIQFFFGYVETYGFFFAWLAVYVATAIAVAQGRAPFWVAAVACVVAAAVHQVGVALLPSLAYLAWLRYPRLAQALRNPKIIAVSGTALVIVGAEFYAHFVADKQLSWFSSRDGRYLPAFGYAHLVEALNNDILTAPFGLAAIILGGLWLWRQRRAPDPALIVLALVWAFFQLNSLTFAAGCGYGDWDVLGLQGLPLALLTIALIFAIFRDAAPEVQRWGRELAVIVLALTGLNTLLFVLVNHTDLSITRAKEVLLTDKAPAYSPYWNGAPIKLGIIFQKNALFRSQPEEQARMMEETAAQYQLGARIFPQSTLMGWNLAKLRIAQGRVSEARALLIADVQKFPLNSLEWKLLLDLDLQLRPGNPSLIIQSGSSLLNVMNQVGHVVCIEGVPFRAAFPPAALAAIQANVGLSLLQLGQRDQALAQLRGCVALGAGAMTVGNTTLSNLVRQIETTNAPPPSLPSLAKPLP